jgi:hypothetical protein
VKEVGATVADESSRRGTRESVEDIEGWFTVEMNATEEHDDVCWQGFQVFRPRLSEDNSFFWFGLRRHKAPTVAALNAVDRNGIRGKGTSNAFGSEAVDSRPDLSADFEGSFKASVERVSASQEEKRPLASNVTAAMSPMAEIVDWVKGSSQVANTTEKFAPGSPGSGTRRGLFDTRAHRLALAEGYSAVEDTGGEASARGIGYVRKDDGIESKAAQVDSSDLGAREVGRRGNIHDILVVAALGGENLRVREFEGAMNKFEEFPDGE